MKYDPILVGSLLRGKDVLLAYHNRHPRNGLIIVLSFSMRKFSQKGNHLGGSRI